MPLGEEIWHDTCIAVASGQYRNIFTGELIQASDSGIPIAEIFKTFPVALLELEI
jgi:maltooligosyltrehalose synthase